MATRRLLRATSAPASAPFVLVAVTAACLVGALAAYRPTLGVAALVALVALPAAVIRPRALLPVLVVGVLAETASVGDVTIGRLLAPIALIAAFSQTLTSPTRLVGARTTLALVAAYGLLALASMIWTVSASGTVATLLPLCTSLAFMIAFAVLVREPRDLRVVVGSVAVVLPLLAAFWLLQYFGGVDRRYNPLGDPNFFAVFQVIGIPLVLVLASSTRAPGRRLLLYLALGVMAASVLATLSRGGLGVLLAAVLLVLLMPWRNLFRSPREKVGFVLAALVGLALLFPVAGPQLIDRFHQNTSIQGAAGGRSDLWRAALHGYRAHPVTGLGFGGFKATSFQQLASTPGVDLATHYRYAVIEGEYVHNAFIESLAELGPLGLALFVGLLVAVARSLRRSAHAAKATGDRFVELSANALLVGVVAFGLASLTLSTETSRILWTIVGLSLALTGMAVSDGPAHDPGRGMAPGPFSEGRGTPKITMTRG